VKLSMAVAAALAAILLLDAGAAAAPDPTTPDAEAGEEDPPPELEITPITHYSSPVSIASDGGSTGRHPPGYWVTEAAYYDLDLALRNAQSTVTRLKAENKVLSEPDGLGWGWLATVAVSVGAGIAIGYYAIGE
jgi:hypothetical protein